VTQNFLAFFQFCLSLDRDFELLVMLLLCSFASYGLPRCMNGSVLSSKSKDGKMNLPLVSFSLIYGRALASFEVALYKVNFPFLGIKFLWRHFRHNLILRNKETNRN
jgi:hypothetical protein